MINEQRVRAILFYLSVLLFISILPLIISFALGYKFNPKKLKFTKTGIIALKTQPTGANVYLDAKLLSEKTPLTINELLPGNYVVRAELDYYYPWVSNVEVDAGRVTRVEKIILFPLRPNLKQINKENLTLFWIDEDNKKIYFINTEENNIYVSDFDGEHYERIASYVAINPVPIKFRLSPDKQQLLYYNRKQIVIVPLILRWDNIGAGRWPVLITYEGSINECFWHSDSFHVIVAGEKRIDIYEARSDSLPTELVALNRKSPHFSYDIDNDVLFFSDFEKAADGNLYNNLYRLELNTKFSPFKELLKMGTGEQQKNNLPKEGKKDNGN